MDIWELSDIRLPLRPSEICGHITVSFTGASRSCSLWALAIGDEFGQPVQVLCDARGEAQTRRTFHSLLLSTAHQTDIWELSDIRLALCGSEICGHVSFTGGSAKLLALALAIGDEFGRFSALRPGAKLRPPHFHLSSTTDQTDIWELSDIRLALRAARFVATLPSASLTPREAARPSLGHQQRL